MIRVGIVGLGGMGRKHFGCYAEAHGAEVVALADRDEAKLQPGESRQRIDATGGGAVIDPDRHRLHRDPAGLIEQPDVDLVDICLPTFLHAEWTKRGLQAGKHVLCEKPMALSGIECTEILRTAETAPGKLMIAHCVRFFPAWQYLKETVDTARLGRLKQISMWRGGAFPRWSWDGWLEDHGRSGGQILDLHIHDADFVHYLLGRPRAVFARATSGPSGGWDVVDTHYVFDDPIVVRAMANSCLPAAFGFRAAFLATFEGGFLEYSSDAAEGMREVTVDGQTSPRLSDKDGYLAEIEYFLRCIGNDEPPGMVPPESSAFSVRLIEAERRSAETGQVIEL